MYADVNTAPKMADRDAKIWLLARSDPSLTYKEIGERHDVSGNRVGGIIAYIDALDKARGMKL